jgi:hypothetical protein
MTQERDIVDELREIQRMNTTLHGAQMAARAADDIERLRGMLEVQDEMVKHYVEERDEARREVCVLMQRAGFLRGDYANERGWDCFKEKP